MVKVTKKFLLIKTKNVYLAFFALDPSLRCEGFCGEVFGGRRFEFPKGNYMIFLRPGYLPQQIKSGVSSFDLFELHADPMPSRRQSDTALLGSFPRQHQPLIHENLGEVRR